MERDESFKVDASDYYKRDVNKKGIVSIGKPRGTSTIRNSDDSNKRKIGNSIIQSNRVN